MQQDNKGFTKVAVAPTEETLSAAGIREIMGQSIRVEESDPSFAYCIRRRQLSTYFCLSSIPIRRGLFIVAAVDICIAVYVMFRLIGVEVHQGAAFYYRIVQMACVFPALACILAARRLETRFARMCYHWKIWEGPVLCLLELSVLMGAVVPAAEAANSKTNYGVWVYFLGKNVLRCWYDLYVAFILYSFIMLIDKKANINLVKYGPDVVKLMENIKKQAAAMEMRTEQLEVSTIQTVPSAVRTPSGS